MKIVSDILSARNRKIRIIDSESESEPYKILIIPNGFVKKFNEDTHHISAKSSRIATLPD